MEELTNMKGHVGTLEEGVAALERENRQLRAERDQLEQDKQSAVSALSDARHLTEVWGSC